MVKNPWPIVIILISIISVACCARCGDDDDSSDDDSANDDDGDGDDDEVNDDTADKAWIPIPLRSPKQKESGIGGGEGMQMIWGLQYAPSDSRIVYLSSDTSQVWKSVNGGISWEMKHKGFLANGGISLTVHHQNPDIVFAAGFQGDFEISDNTADGIYRTSDGGESWNLVHATHFYRLGEDKGGVNIAFVGSQTIYVGTHEDGLLRSTSGGDTWESLGILNSTPILDIKLAQQNPTILFIATKDGLYRYQDGDDNQAEKIGNDLPEFPRCVVIRPDAVDTIFVSVGKFGVYKSLDGGISFQSANNGLDPLNQDDGYNATYLAMSPVNPCRLYVSFFEFGGNHPYITDDCAASWQAPLEMDVGGLISAVNNDNGGEYWSTPIAPSPDDENIALTSGAGNHIEKTIDGGNTWAYSGSGYTGGRAGIAGTSFGWDPNDPDRFAIFLIDFGVVLTKDGGVTFKNLKLPEGHGGFTTPVGALDPDSDSETIVTALGNWEKQVIAVTHDEGGQWTTFPGTEDSFRFISFHPQNQDTVYAGRFKSTDNGNTWAELSHQILAIYEKDGDMVYATQNDGAQTIILKSTDGGESWSQPYPTLDAPFLHELTVDHDNQDRLYAAVEQEALFILKQNQWHQASKADGFEEDRFGALNTRNVAIDPINPNVIYAGRWISHKGHSNGIFRSEDYGETWENITYNLGPEFTTWAISVNPHDRNVYIGSSHGTWKLPVD